MILVATINHKIFKMDDGFISPLYLCGHGHPGFRDSDILNIYYDEFKIAKMVKFETLYWP